jgi:hypothetical protein
MFYYLHSLVVIDFEEVPAASVFRRAELGAAGCLRTVTTYEISPFQKLQDDKLPFL